MAQPGLDELFSTYDVSSYGRVRSHLHIDATTGEPYILAPSLNRSGYTLVELTDDNGKGHVVLIHRLVCSVWHGPQPSPKHVVAHLFDVKTLNTPQTLAWVTRGENMRQAYRNGCRVPSRAKGPLSAASVRAIRLRANSGETVPMIARDLGLPREVVRRAAINQTYQWVKATLAETEKVRRAEDERRRQHQAARRSQVDQLELAGLERAAAPEGQRRRRAPHTPAAMPRSRAK